MPTRKVALPALIYVGRVPWRRSGFTLGQTPAGGPDAGISEAAIPGAGVGQFSADVATGRFDQTFTATGPTTFLAEGIFNAGTWNVDGSAVSSQLGGIAPVGYDPYAKFAEAGTFAPTGTGFTYMPTSRYVELWADPSQNTNYGVGTAATGNVNNLQLFSGAASVTDDILLAIAAGLLSGSGSSTAGVANGLFQSTLGGLTLTATGAQYFAARDAGIARRGNRGSRIRAQASSIAHASARPRPASAGRLVWRY
jgi:hypothetical protein